MDAAIIGSGKWGLNHVKTMYNILEKYYKNNYSLTVCDVNDQNEKTVKTISQKIIFTTDLNTILENNKINIAIVSTPAETHYAVTKTLLESGKNVLTEKPLTFISKETEDLIQIAEERNLKLMTGHVLLFHPAVKKMKELIDINVLGKIHYIYSNRLNLGTVRKQENILYSFAPHDVSIIQFLLGTYPVHISASGGSYLQKGIEDTTITILKYPDNIHCHIFVSWLHPFKEQRFVVVGDQGMLVFEDSAKTEKLKYYSKGFNVIDGELEKFDSSYEVVEFENSPALENEQLHFIDAVLNNKIPLADGHHALEVLRILESAQEYLKNIY
ncbi:MAG TPA: Gfo/Idh/MocA family oxidoreductase [Ignavibacteria bacterium]